MEEKMKENLKIELKRKTNVTGFVILILFITFALFINQSSVSKIEELEKTKAEFIKNENKKVELTDSYSQYGGYGFKYLFVPPNIGLMFNSTTLINLQASIDTGFKFDIFNPNKGKYIFKRGINLYWYLYVIGSGIALILGLLALRNRKFHKLLVNSSFKSKFSVFFSIMAAHSILLFLSMCILTICLIAQYYINGVSLTGLLIPIIKIIFYTYCLMIFFHFSGAILGTMESASKIGIIAFVFWFTFIFLLPNFFNLKFSEKADKNIRSIYPIETEKVQILYEFEKRRLNYIEDKEDKLKATKEFTEKFLNDGIAEKLELDLIEETEKNIKKFHLWSILNPTTFYESVKNENCGIGLNENQRFCRESIIKKREFSKYCINKIFSKKKEKVKPFLPGDEQIFYAKYTRPNYFLLGVIVQVFYILSLFVIGYCRFNRVMFPRDKKGAFSKIDLKLKKGKHHVYNYNANDPNFPDQAFNVFMGQTGKFTGKISIDGEKIVSRERKNCVYLPVPDALPGQMRVKSIINLLAGLYEIPKPEKEKVKEEFKKILKERFENIESIKKVNLMLRMAEFKKADIYLLHNFLVYIEKEETLKHIIDEIKQEGALIFETNSIYVYHMRPDCMSKIRLTEGSKYKELKVLEL